MASIFSENGYKGRIWSNDHPPPHIHVFHDNKEVVIGLGCDTEKPYIYDARTMPARFAKKALELVEKHQVAALKKWEEIHE